jgi:hypothetical protein
MREIEVKEPGFRAKNEVKGPTHAAHLECALTSPGCTIALFYGPKFERIRALD